MKTKFKTFAVIACTAACAFSLPACSAGKSTQLGKPAEATPLSYSEMTDEGFVNFKKDVDKFASSLAPSIYKTCNSGDNLAVSPVSVYMALSLAAECAAGETRTDVLNALGVTYEQLRSFIPVLYRSLNAEYKNGNTVTSKLSLGNSIWVNSDTAVKDDCIKSLSDYYYSYSYSADFKYDNINANKAVRDFVKKQTNGIIDKDFQLSDETLFALINTLYLKTIWNTDGDDLPFTQEKYSFEQSDGSEKDIKLLQGYYKAGRVYESEKYSAFYTSTENGYKIKFILPKDGNGIDSVFNTETLAEVNGLTDYNAVDDENGIRYLTRCIFPEFKSSYNDDIREILKSSFGINLLFDRNVCDYSTLTDVKAYCKAVRHVAELKVDKTGIEGAAVTIIVNDNAMSADPGEYEIVLEDFVVDKSFGYIITDRQDVTLFSGVINKV